MVAFRLLKGKEIGVSDELTDKFLDEKAAKKLTMGPSFLDPALGEGLLSRHKFFTARLQEAVATRGGSPQVVSLGVGFDTRALTEECLEGLDVFEVDFPAVLEDKYSTLARGGVPRPPSVRAVGADLNSAVPALAEAGFNPAASPPVVLIEGLLYYLKPEMQRKVLSPSYLGLPKGTPVLFDVIGQDKITFVNEGFLGLGFGSNLWEDTFLGGASGPAEVAEAIKALGYSRAEVKTIREVGDGDWGELDWRLSKVDRLFGVLPLPKLRGGPDAGDSWYLVVAEV
mmetsp:Transcript_16984/g.53940  ORF Transcript_16984/g.53940 Transcript_16984/m.53940 type:complete len:284 (+) Transcript_16984:476-1327(+)